MKQTLEQFLASRGAIALAMVIALVWGIWYMPLYDLDEGAFTEATREMMETGNYISIYLNGEPRNDKPILIYWLQAASAQVFGLNEFALRLPSVLCALAWVFVVYRFTARHLDVATAGVAALLLPLSLFVSLIGRAAVADALLNLLIALAMLEIFGYYRRPSRGALRRVFVWLGLGFLAKGPVAVVFPFLVSGLFYLSYGRWREWLRLVFDPAGLLIFAAIVLPWHIAVYLDSGWTFFEGFYLHHNVDRYRAPMEGHGGGLLYYVLMTPLIVMPFGGWLIAQLAQLKRVATDPLDRFMWLWFFCVMLVFSFSGTKLPHYMLYGVTGVLVLMARDRDRLRSPWLVLIPPLILFGLLGVLPQLFSLAAGQTERVYEKSLFNAAVAAFAGWGQAFALGMLALAVVVAFLKLAVWRRVALLGFLQALLVSTSVAPTVIDILQRGPKEAGLFARANNKDLVFYRSYQPSVSVYSRQVIRHRPARPGQWAYVRVDHVGEYLNTPSPYRKKVVFSHPPATLIAVDER